MQLPPPSQKRLQQREELVRRLRELLGDPDQVIYRPEDLVVYECDALACNHVTVLGIQIKCLGFASGD